MRMSKLFGMTLRDVPSEADIASHQLLLRAGYIRQSGAGIFSYLHLARRTMTKIENIMRQEMDAIGGQEITMPVVHQADIWQESGRWYQVGAEMGRFKDRNDHDMVLAMTHEEMVCDLLRREIQSYKQLPRMVYHIQTKWRDDPRPRGGLIRVREFTMKDSYSLDRDSQGLDQQYQAHYQAYFNIYHRCGIPVVAVKSDTGMMGGKVAHEFIYLTPIGEDTLLICDRCGYMANRQIAQFRKPVPPTEAPRPVERVETPNASSIEELATFLDVPKSRTAKAVFLMASIIEEGAAVEKMVFAVVRGDMDVNETKLTNAIHAQSLRPARDEEIRACGAIPGYASPIKIRNALVVVDDLIPDSPNLVAGANEEGYHLKNINYGRDYQADTVVDIAAAEDGCACPSCGETMRASRGVEIGNIFKLGTRYSEAMGCMYQDRDGAENPVVMGSYGIGVGRLLACIVEEHHDDHGLVWPVSIAPFHIHLISLKEGQEKADEIYSTLVEEGWEVLYDDRDESPGVKFNDADLIGNPIRLTVSKRSLQQGGVEMKLRHEKEKSLVASQELLTRVSEELSALEKKIADTVIQVSYSE